MKTRPLSFCSEEEGEKDSHRHFCCSLGQNIWSQMFVWTRRRWLSHHWLTKPECGLASKLCWVIRCQAYKVGKQSTKCLCCCSSQLVSSSKGGWGRMGDICHSVNNKKNCVSGFQDFDPRLRWVGPLKTRCWKCDRCFCHSLDCWFLDNCPFL